MFTKLNLLCNDASTRLVLIFSTVCICSNLHNSFCVRFFIKPKILEGLYIFFFKLLGNSLCKNFTSSFVPLHCSKPLYLSFFFDFNLNSIFISFSSFLSFFVSLEPPSSTTLACTEAFVSFILEILL